MEFDHLFICLPEQAVEADRLIECGFSEGSGNRHRGQGTANRRFFFNNAFIEFLYVENSVELDRPPTRPTRLKERLSPDCSLVSPFGLCFRPSAEHAGLAQPPFQSKRYQPDYLPSHLHVDIADSPLTEPMWFYLSFGGRPDHAPADRREALDHPCGVSEITAVRMSGPGVDDLSEAAECILRCVSGPVVQFEQGDAVTAQHCIEVEFDCHRQQQQHDFRPHLPMVCKW